MKLTVTAQVLDWFKTDWRLTSGDAVRIFVRYGGSSTVQTAFSLGITKEDPKEIGLSTTADGILFFMEQDDIWYLSDKDLTVDYKQATDEVIFQVT